MSVIITEPGIYDIPEADYHRDPVPGGSLSASTAKRLLADGGPARWRHQADHPEPPSKEMELGTVAHKIVFGVGAPVEVIAAENWRGKKASDDAEAARKRGAVPLLAKEMEVVHAMAGALRRHPVAAAILSPERGRPEMSAFWVDGRSGLWCRCRFDLLPRNRPGRVAVIGDYKTTKDASPRGFAKSVADFGYHVQGAQYVRAWRAIYGTDAAFALVAQEKTPPYLVGVYQLDAEALAIGAEAMDRAMEVWRDCREAEAAGAEGAWPGYSQEIETISLPRWSRAREEFYA